MYSLLNQIPMLNKIIHFSIKHKLIVGVTTLALIVWGLWSASKLPVDAILDTLTETLSKKESVAFLGFGTFSTASRDARVSRVPGTDKTVNVPATTVAKFKVGKALKDAVANAK